MAGPLVGEKVLGYIQTRPSEKEPRGALMSGLSSGYQDLKGLMWSGGAAFADALGANSARDKMNDYADDAQIESRLRGRSDLDNIEDVYNDPSKYLDYLAYQVGKQGPNIAGGIAAGALLPEVYIPAALSRGAAMLPRAIGGGGLRAGMSAAEEAIAAKAGQQFAGQVMGGAGWNYGQSVGSLYQAAQDGGQMENAGIKSILGGVPYALAETLPEAMFMGRIGHGATGSLPSRMAKGFATQGATGATSELAQTAMENAYNGTLTPDQERSNYLNAGVAGGLVEGLMGGLGGIRRSRPAVAPGKALESGGSADLLTGSTSASGPSSAVVPYTPQAPNFTMGEGGFMNPGALMPTQQQGGALDLQFPDFQRMPQGIPMDQQQLLPAPPAQARTNDPGVLYASPSGLVAPNSRMLSGEQQEMFPGARGPDFGTAGPSVAPQEMQQGPSVAVPDTQTRDMFPGAPVPQVPQSSYPTANFPLLSAQEAAAQNPAHAEGQSAGAANQPTGAVTGALSYIRSKLSGMTGMSGAGVLHGALNIANAISTNKITELQTKLDAEQKSINKAWEKMDTRITLDPEGTDQSSYSKDMDKLTARQKLLDAQKQFLKEHFGGVAANAARLTEASPIQGQTVDKTQQSTAAEDAIREQDLTNKIAAVDQEGDISRAAKTDTERMAVIRKAFGEDVNGRNPLRVARKALRAAGFNNMDLSTQEQELAQGLAQKQADVRAATVQPPALAAKQGKLVSRESLNGQEAPLPESQPATPSMRESIPDTVAPAVAESEAASPEPVKATPVNKGTAPVVETAKPESTTSVKPAESVPSKPKQSPVVDRKEAIKALPADKRKEAKEHEKTIDKYERLLSCLRAK